MLYTINKRTLFGLRVSERSIHGWLIPRENDLVKRTEKFLNPLTARKQRTKEKRAKNNNVLFQVMPLVPHFPQGLIF